MARTKSSQDSIETVEPIGNRVLIRKDEDKKQTKSGIHLPDKIEIPTLTGRIVAISAQVEHDEDYPICQYDRDHTDDRGHQPQHYGDPWSEARREHTSNH